MFVMNTSRRARSLDPVAILVLFNNELGYSVRNMSYHKRNRVEHTKGAWTPGGRTNKGFGRRLLSSAI